MILITTAGKVGSEAARLLAQRQEPARVLVRDPERARCLFAQGDADYVTDDVPSLPGRPARAFEQLATDYAEAFS